MDKKRSATSIVDCLVDRLTERVGSFEGRGKKGRWSCRTQRVQGNKARNEISGRVHNDR